MEKEAEVIGIDHVYLAVRSMAAAEAFYDTLLGKVLGFRKSQFTLGSDPHVQYYNRQFGVVIRPAAAAARAPEPGASGLHHFCLRVESEREVGRVAGALRARGIDATPARLYTEYAPDYCATFFRDPDGVRLEVTNFRAERRERMNHWERGAPAEVSLSDRIRPATLDDCGALASFIGELASEGIAADGGIADAAVAPAVTEATVRNCLGFGDHLILVATDRGRIVGYAAVHWIPLPRLSGTEGYVSDLYVADSHRGGGLGGRLMDAVEGAAIDRGCMRLMLNNRVATRSFARGFYPKLGFRQRDEFANFVKALAPAAGTAP